MGHGIPKSRLLPSFENRLHDLEQKARDQSAHFKNHDGTRPWHTPDSMATKDLLDVPSLHEPAWNRDDCNRMYVEEILSAAPGTQGDIISLKRQIDFLAVEERAWRARHATFARCAAHAHGRLDGHGVADNGIFSRVRQAAESARLRGQASKRAADDPSLSANYVA